MVDFKYKEDEKIKELLKYVENTYGEHYVNKTENDDTVQYLDVVFSKPNKRGLYFCTDNAGKYLNRYGIKEGHNRKDLMKALHYLLLALYNHDNEFNCSVGDKKEEMVPLIERKESKLSGYLDVGIKDQKSVLINNDYILRNNEN